jgi:hypothetical protein
MELRRYNVRRKFRSLVLVAPDQESAFWGISRDISARGLFIATPRPLAIGKRLKVEVVPPRGSEELRVVATVVRSLDDGFACEFVQRPERFASRFSRYNTRGR